MLTLVLHGVPIDRVDRRSKIGVLLRRVRDDLIEQLGGEANTTPGQRLIVDEVARATIITRDVGEWLLVQEALVRDGSELPIVLKHAAHKANLGHLVGRIGLGRRKSEAE